MVYKLCKDKEMNKVSIRLLKDDIEDYKLLEKWYQQEEIYSSFEQRVLSLEEIKNKYSPRTKEASLVPVFMIMYDNKPVGIIQYKCLTKKDLDIYKLVGNNIYEIDIFIGELKEHNKGIGSAAVNIISDMLYENKQAELLVMCPLASNKPAIKCYEKCGFQIINKFSEKDTVNNIQDYFLMIK